MADLDLVPYLLSSETEHWVRVDINDKPRAFKYCPLSLREKININNRHSFIEDVDDRRQKTVLDYCYTMLLKAYQDKGLVDSLTNPVLAAIYEAIVLDMETSRKSIESFYEENKSSPMVKRNYPSNKLDSLVNMGGVMKECGLTVKELADLDELSLFSLMIYMSESGVRQSNYLETSKGKK